MMTHIVDEKKIGITQADSAKLTAPFAAKDHEFNRGFIYIEETAVCARIEEVDFSWEWKTLEMSPAENGIVTVVGVLTICGISRYGTGQQVIQLDGKDRETVGEARKGATTDALKRAARLFGIGRYLLQCPKEVKGPGSELDRWLKSLSGGKQAPIAPAPTMPPQQVAPAPAKPEGHWSTDDAMMGKMYTWAQDKWNASRDQVNAAIAASGKTLLDLSRDEVKEIVAESKQRIPF
jgi:hypothetical protein